MKFLILLVSLFMVGCASLKLPTCVIEGTCSGDELIEAKNGGLRTLTAIQQSKEREARWSAIQKIAEVKRNTDVGEATQAMLIQGIVHGEDGVEAAAYFKAEAEITRRPWDFARTALWAIPAAYVAFGGGANAGDGSSYESTVNVGGDLNASNSGNPSGGGEGGGVASNRSLAIGSFGTGAVSGDRSGVTWGPFGVNEGSGFLNNDSERSYNFKDNQNLQQDNFDRETIQGPLGF